jgi:hypothetical protein
LTADTTGDRTVAIGHSALYTQNFTGGQITYNTAVGFEAAYNLTTGVQNTFIGYQAGTGASNA